MDVLTISVRNLGRGRLDSKIEHSVNLYILKFLDVNLRQVQRKPVIFNQLESVGSLLPPFSIPGQPVFFSFLFFYQAFKIDLTIS